MAASMIDHDEMLRLKRQGAIRRLCRELVLGLAALTFFVLLYFVLNN